MHKDSHVPKLKEMFPSKYLRAADFEDGDAVLTIERVEPDKVGMGKDAKDVWVVYFEGEDKGLILNKTNTNTVAKLYGDDTDDWIGKPVTLFATEVQFQSEMVEAIRVRSKPPKRPVAKAAPAKAAKAAEPGPSGDDDGDDDVPF